jgi:hypothetical protein
MHTNSKLLFEKYARRYFDSGMKVLEIGPDGFPSSYRKIVANENISWDTLDIYESSALTYSKSNLYSFAIPDDTYDIVLSGQVLEHIAKIWRWMPELARVTKPQGRVITISPVSWPYHEVPIDCWRTFPDGMKALCEDSNLRVEVSLFESLELPISRRALPGRSAESQRWQVRLCFRLLGIFGFPVEKAFDTITIAVKV